MKVGFLQFSPEFGKPELNIKLIKKMIKDSTLPEILVLPELALTGYTFLNYDEAFSFSEDLNGPLISELIQIAQDNNIIMAVGFLEREFDNIYNSSVLVSGEGIIGIYRKVHLFCREKEIFKPGNKGFPIFRVNDINIGLLVCFDWIFPEAMRTLALKGADIILHSSNLVLPYYQEAAKTRAIENRVFIVLANRTGSEKRVGLINEFTGGSEIVNPDGKILIKATGTDAGIYSCDINYKESRNKRITEFNDVIRDRRIEFYEGWNNR